jgi:type IV pilus biogenesis protein CpaD/CtpE
MPIQELVVRFEDRIWQVRLGDHLLSGQPTQMAAINVAHTIAHAAAARGARSKILVVDIDGSSIEFPVIAPLNQPAATAA